MSNFNKKGYTTVMARTKDNDTPHPVAVPKGSFHDAQQQRMLKKFKKQQKAAFREYKKQLKEQKKSIPIEERAKVNISQLPKRYL